MKRYAIVPLTTVRIMYTDLQATVRALEVAREAFSEIARLSNDSVPIHIAKLSVDKINQTLGKAGV
jgi:hypothetical protein